MRFTPKENFNYTVVDEVGVQRHVAAYVEGMTYHCRTEQLEKKAIAWAGEGKVTLVDAPPAPIINPVEE